MSEAKYGEEFIKHEFDEAIAIQRSIVEAGASLAQTHPQAEAKTALRAQGRTDQQTLKSLEKLGRRFGATGEVEEIASSLRELAATTTEAAAEAPSEAYEAHAVLLNLLRKQQDSAAAMVKIAQKRRDPEIKEAAAAMQKQTKASADALAKLLAAFAVEIAMEESPAA